jgi:hypothetical protein
MGKSRQKQQQQKKNPAGLLRRRLRFSSSFSRSALVFACEGRCCGAKSIFLRKTRVKSLIFGNFKKVYGNSLLKNSTQI